MLDQELGDDDYVELEEGAVASPSDPLAEEEVDESEYLKEQGKAKCSTGASCKSGCKNKCKSKCTSKGCAKAEV